MGFLDSYDFNGFVVIDFLLPRLKILKFSKRDDDRKFFLLFVAMLFICGTMINTQFYLYESTGSLTEVDSYLDIKDSSVKYVNIKRYYTLNDNQVGFYADVSVSGRYSDRLNFDFYFVFPLYIYFFFQFSHILPILR